MIIASPYTLPHWNENCTSFQEQKQTHKRRRKRKKKPKQWQQQKLESTHQQIGQQQQQKSNRAKQNKKSNHLTELATHVTHVLQAPDTLPYHSLELDRLGLYVRLPLFIEKIMVDQAPSHCFSEIKGCRIVKPDGRVSKLNSRIEHGLYVGSSHPKTMFEIAKPHGKTMKIFGRSWWTFKLCCKKGCMM